MSAAPRSPLNGELTPVGRITFVGCAFAGLGLLTVALIDAAAIRHPALAVATAAAALVMGTVCLLLPWERLSATWLLLPAIGGITLTAIGIWSGRGTHSPYAFFYFYVAAMAAYFADRRRMLVVVALISVAAALPMAYDQNVAFQWRLLQWLVLSSTCGALAIILQGQRARLRQAAAQAQTLALIDPLTGVANRRGFDGRVAAEIARSRRRDERFMLLYVDLDGFKRVNDLIGHAAGDDVLRRVAHAIASTVRGEDFVGRYGGDEFVVLVPHAGEQEAEPVSARIVAAIERVAAEDPRAAELSASIGRAGFPADGRAIDELMDVADAELRRVKRHRRSDRAPAPVPDHLPELLEIERSHDRLAAAPANGRVEAPVAPRRSRWPWFVLIAAAALGAWWLGPLVAPKLVVAILVPVVATLVGILVNRRTEAENRRLSELARRREHDLAMQYRSSLVALGTALEARDGYTGTHGERTVSLAHEVCERLGFAPHAIAEVETVALLHDVGKIGMPDDILRKEGPLDDSEWAVMRQHPVVGERILRTVPGLERVARAVRHEHERWDGTGYPDGLSGEAIPLASRIVLVCDAYHAMTSNRPYRSAMSLEYAIEQLREGAGSHFDPTVTRALLDIVGAEVRAPAPVQASAETAAAPR